MGGKARRNQKELRSQVINSNPTSVEWSGVKQQEPFCTTSTILTVLGVLLLILMVDLYFFVEDSQVQVPRQAQPQPEQAAPKNFTRPPKRPTFEITEEVDIATLQTLIKEME